ncbi:MAG TPA: ABC transporter substrate-binding protein [Candidatus Binatia bacterium]
MNLLSISDFEFSIGKSARNKLSLAALIASILALAFSAEAQQPTKVSRIGVIGLDSRTLEVFQQSLRNLGHVPGRDIELIYRNIQGQTDHMPDLLGELLQLNVDVLVINNPTLIRAAQRATQTVPIVFLTNQDPVAAGFVTSLARPGGNLTGIASLVRDLSGKRLEVLRECVPRVSRIGILWITPTALGTGSAFQSYEAAARAFKLELQSLQMHRPNPDLKGAFQNAIKTRVNGLIAVTNAVLNVHSKEVVDFAIRNQIPLMVEGTRFVEGGGLISYASSNVDSYRRAAAYVDKILKGATPGDLPIEQSTKFELAVNLNTAKQIGLTIPQTVLYRADKIVR